MLSHVGPGNPLGGALFLDGELELPRTLGRKSVPCPYVISCFLGAQMRGQLWLGCALHLREADAVPLENRWGALRGILPRPN